MKNKLAAWLCLLSLLCSLLAGCSGSAPAETDAPATELAVTTETTTEPITVPTEPKTFFEEQGFVFWEDFYVSGTLADEDNKDEGIFAEANILDSTECKVTITSGNREETTYCLADTEVKVYMDEYTLAEFDEECKEKNWDYVNIKDVSDSLYKEFKEEDHGLTKETWLEKYQDFKVIHYEMNRRIRAAREVNNAKQAMNIGESQWLWAHGVKGSSSAIVNCINGNVYEPMSIGVAAEFLIATETGVEKMAAVFDYHLEHKESGVAADTYVIENWFVMIPDNCDNLTFVVPLAATERSLEAFDADIDEASENAWEEKTFAEYTEGKDHLKYYFLSPYHH